MDNIKAQIINLEDENILLRELVKDLYDEFLQSGRNYETIYGGIVAAPKPAAERAYSIINTFRLKKEQYTKRVRDLLK